MEGWVGIGRVVGCVDGCVDRGPWTVDLGPWTVKRGESPKPATRQQGNKEGMPRPRVLLAALAHITPHWARVCPPWPARDSSAPGLAGRRRVLNRGCAQNFQGGSGHRLIDRLSMTCGFGGFEPETSEARQQEPVMSGVLATGLVK